MQVSLPLSCSNFKTRLSKLIFYAVRYKSCTGLLSIGKRVLEVEQQNEELTQQQAAQKYDDPDAKIYSRAVKMVELGADLEEVIRECELPRAEAELLFSLHKQKGA